MKHNQAEDSRATEPRNLQQYRAAGTDDVGCTSDVIALIGRAPMGKLVPAEQGANGLGRTSVRTAILLREESQTAGTDAKPFNKTLPQTASSEAVSSL